MTIQQVRIIKGLKQSAFYIPLGITQAMFSKIENKKSETSYSNYVKIAEILEIDVDFVLSNEIPVYYKIKNKFNPEAFKDMNVDEEVREIFEIFDLSQSILHKMISKQDKLKGK